MFKDTVQPPLQYHKTTCNTPGETWSCLEFKPSNIVSIAFYLPQSSLGLLCFPFTLVCPFDASWFCSVSHA